MSALQVASVYIAINILLLVWLAFRVVSRRFRGKISMGDGGSEDLAKAIRVHGNASEYTPAMLIGLLALAFLQGPIWIIHALGIGFTVGRVSHAIGMGSGPLILRQLGMVLTWTAMVILSLALLYMVFS
ncbi:MAG: MAPEG family protein [Henriciella sp.]|nr:MAPEG family protein [Henriciella sp.]